MKISANVESLLNEQYHKETQAGMQYMAMASYFLVQELNGFANFFLTQGQEEFFHARKIFDYLHTVEGKITPSPLEACRADFASPLQVFEISLQNEREVSRAIHRIAHAAVEERDYATHTFLQWFINEQIEEEEMFKLMTGRLKLIGQDTAALFIMDNELSKRKFEGSEA
ncbi:MAG: ferritin [Bacteroidia bacterium]|nr:ferritin [Bacteroidia bacterium]MDW8334143.1 ferritin [Bacteroidia bacterium]